MSEPHERLQQARGNAGYSTATEAAQRRGWTVSTYLGHENGTRGLRAPTAATYAEAFNVEPAWLLYGEASDKEVSPVAGRIQARMAALGLNPFSAANRAGLHPDAVRNILRGKSREPGAETLSAIARVLETTTDYLLFGTPSVAPANPDGNSTALFQPASRPGGSEEMGRQPALQISRAADAAPDVGVSTLPSTPPGRVTLNINATVSIGVAAKILAMIEGDQS